jgi:two-component system, LuxR family, response regulator FixJ
MSHPIVWVVDDDRGVLHAIGFLLESVGLHASTHSSAEDFFDAYDAARPGCIILDIRMPGTSGVALQQELLERGSTHPVVFVTAHADVPTTVEIMKAGAEDLIEKPFREQQLLDRVTSLLKENVRSHAGEAAKGEWAQRLATLTPREREVMHLVVEGCSSKVIAAELGISQRTVDVHRARMMRKLEVHSAAKLVRLVMGQDA